MKAAGERHGMSKLTDRERRAIRAAYPGFRTIGTARELAARYGVNESTIRRIWRTR